MSNTGVISMGVRCPIIRQGDNLVDIVIENVKKTLDENHMSLEDKDVIGITESVVARAQGNYVTVDDIVQFLKEHSYPKYIGLYRPIFSRNRFSMILKAFARHCDKIVIYHGEFDDQGNPCLFPNPFTGVDIREYYKQLCKDENCELEFDSCDMLGERHDGVFDMDARCHPEFGPSLLDVMREPIIKMYIEEDYSRSLEEQFRDAKLGQSGYNKDWGLLGSNKANEETLKLFPRKEEAQKLVDSIQKRLLNETGKRVEVLVYGDGNFCSPAIPGVQGSQINEWADPCNPAWTHESGLLDTTPNEVKVKALADGKFKHLNGKELEDAIAEEIKNKEKDLKNNMASQGTTPRRRTDLLASLCDLISGSGDRATPIVYIHNYL